MSDDDDIINLDEARGKRARPAKPRAKVSKSDFLEPVGITFIAAALKVDKGVVQKRLAGLAPVAKDPHPRFHFHEAARRVIRAETGRGVGSAPGALTLEQIAALSPDNFPKNAHAEFWNGMIRRRQFYEEANQLWSTSQVQEALDDVVDVFRSAVLSLGDRLKEAQRNGQSVEQVQREILVQVNDAATKATREMSLYSAAGEYSLWEERLISDADDASDDALADDPE